MTDSNTNFSFLLSGAAYFQQPQQELLEAGPREGQVRRGRVHDLVLRQAQQQTIHSREAHQIRLQGNFFVYLVFFYF